MSEVKNKYVRVGTVMKSKENEGSYIVLGNPTAKEEKYRTTVELTVRDSAGNIVASQTGGFLNVNDPHEKAPKFILKEISLKLPA